MTHQFYNHNANNQTKTNNFRSCMNFIKTCIIQDVVCKKNSSILDLCCGKGGDVFKFQRAGCSFYTGVDYSNESVIEAKKRSRHIKNQVRLHTYDVSKNLYFLDTMYDYIFCNFAIHYMCSNRHVLESFFANVSKYLLQEGLFVCTTCSVCSVEACILDRKKEGQFTISKVQNKPPSVFGNPYMFDMKDCVHAPEYLVPVEEMRNIGLRFCLEMECCVPFGQLYKQYRQKHHHIFTYFNAEWEKEADLYQMMVFRKR